MGLSSDLISSRILPIFGGIEVAKATYVKHSFPKHTHDTFSFGLIEEGVNSFFCSGQMWRASKGSICVVSPGEVHTGETGQVGWTYYNIHPPAELLDTLSVDICGRNRPSAQFTNPVIEDAIGANLLRLLFKSLNGPQATLSVETAFVSAFSWLLTQHSDRRPRAETRCKIPLSLVLEYINANLDRDISLADVAAIAGTSKFHFLRAFKATVGISPYSYVMQQRLERARQQLLRGISIADVSASCGYADQSHFTHHFRRMFGVTPGSWKRHSTISRAK